MQIEFLGGEISFHFYTRENCAKTKPLYGKPFVYGLIKNGEIIYIGATVSIYERLSQHRCKLYYSSDKPFDSFFLLEYPNRAIAFEKERIHIFNLKPQLNKVHKKQLA